MTAVTRSDGNAMKGKPPVSVKSGSGKLPEIPKASKIKKKHVLAGLFLLLLLAASPFAVKAIRLSALFASNSDLTGSTPKDVPTEPAAQTQASLPEAGDVLSGEEMQKLADSPDAKERAFVAGRLELPESIMEQLSRDSDRRVREALGGNPAVQEYLSPPEDMPELKDIPQISTEKLDSLHNEAAQLAEDPEVLEDLEEAGAEWHIVLRQKLNSSFRKNVYDPLELVILVLNEARGYENTIDSPESFELFIEDEGIPDNVKDYVRRVSRFADNIVSGMVDEITPSVEEALEAQRDSIN